MTNAPELGQRRKINWLNVNTVLSAAILIGAEVFGAAYAGGWAVAMLLGLGDYRRPRPARPVLRAGLAVMISFIRQASRVEPFTRVSSVARASRTTLPSALTLKKFSPRVRFFLIVTAQILICALAQFRTCLWPCVGRWASGQEAGQPPEEANWLP